MKLDFSIFLFILPFPLTYYKYPFGIAAPQVSFRVESFLCAWLGMLSRFGSLKC